MNKDDATSFNKIAFTTHTNLFSFQLLKREVVLLSGFGFCTGYTLSALPDLPIVLLYPALFSGKLTLRDSLLLCLLVRTSQQEISARDWRLGGQIGQKKSFIMVSAY